MGDALWFYWPVTIALITGLNVRPLVRRGATGSAAIAVLSAAILVVPLMLNIRVRCIDNDGQDLDALIGSGWVLGASLFIGVGWLFILNRLQVRAGEDRADADRTTLWSLGVAVLVAPIEALMSFSSMEAHCTGNGGFRTGHLALAAIVLVVGLVTGRHEAEGRLR